MSEESNEARLDRIETDLAEIRRFLGELTKVSERLAGVVDQTSDHEARLRTLEHGHAQQRAEGHSISNLDNRMDAMEARHNRMAPVFGWLARVSALVVAGMAGAAIQSLLM